MLTARDRKAELVRRGISMSEIGRSLVPPVSPQQMSEVIGGRRRSNRIEQAVAAALELPVEEVFPPRHPEGRRATAPA